MHSDLIECGWTEEHWARICNTVTEEAQKARIAAQILPMSGPEHPSTIAIPHYALSHEPGDYTPPSQRLAVNSDPTLFITNIAVNVELRNVEAAEPELRAALVKFRRAANYIARIEDALIFNGRNVVDLPPPAGVAGIPLVYRVTGNAPCPGIFEDHGISPSPDLPEVLPDPAIGPAQFGAALVTAITRCIGQLERRGQLGPYACILGEDLFTAVCNPTGAMVMPRDRILPLLQGPLVRTSAIRRGVGAVIALSGNPVEVVVGSDIGVRYLQTSMEPRYVFRVCERVALRIRERSAIALMVPHDE